MFDVSRGYDADAAMPAQHRVHDPRDLPLPRLQHCSGRAGRREEVAQLRRHELRLADGSLHSLIEWSGSDLSDALAKAKLAVPLREEGTAVDRPTTRIVLGSQSAAA